MTQEIKTIINTNDNKNCMQNYIRAVVCGYVTAIKQLWTKTKGTTERVKIKIKK